MSKKFCRHAIRGASLQQPFFSPNKKAVLFLFSEKTFLYSFFVQLRNVPELLPKIFWQSSTSPHLLLSDKKFRSAEEEGEGEQQGSDQLWLSSKKPFLPVLSPPQPLPTLFISPPPSYSQPIKPSEGPIETPSRVGLEVFKIFLFFPGELIIFCGRPRCGGGYFYPRIYAAAFLSLFRPFVANLGSRCVRDNLCNRGRRGEERAFPPPTCLFLMKFYEAAFCFPFS